ncbi:hypothetical protein [Gelidibacter maritimus]|uniref:Uncharacterized protein n=1 Tax=Gelidibacter maritimus TaxID=2761487 RepID=A0A7W2R488_9FLAO|nr:hypothetical protein [Gelidibacter maritimus]MBA6152815.1 hypothetical protein [Gelidibacter maritimus]
MPKIKINTFGEGIEIRQLHLGSDTYQRWQAIATKKNRSIPDLILDPFFYYGLKDKKIKKLEDIEANLISGMLNTPKSQIEIWFDRRKVLKIPAHELFNELVLYPLFNLESKGSFLSEEVPKGIYVVQRTIGLLNSEQLEVDSPQLDIEDFTFKTAKFENLQFATEITYQDQYLNFIKNDTMVTYQTAFEVL